VSLNSQHLCIKCKAFYIILRKTLHLMNSEMAIKVVTKPFLNCSVSPKYLTGLLFVDKNQTYDTQTNTKNLTGADGLFIK